MQEEVYSWGSLRYDGEESHIASTGPTCACKSGTYDQAACTMCTVLLVMVLSLVTLMEEIFGGVSWEALGTGTWQCEELEIWPCESEVGFCATPAQTQPSQAFSSLQLQPKTGESR